MQQNYYIQRNQKYLFDLEKIKLQLSKFCEQNVLLITLQI
jgi:hypothetical protein